MRIIRLISLAISFFIISLVFSQVDKDTRNNTPKTDINYSESLIFEIINIRGRPSLSHYWETFPTVRVCHESGVTDSNARTSIRYWERIGYKFNNIILDNKKYSEACSGNSSDSEITVMLIDNNVDIGNNLAVTKVFFDTRTNKIIKAQIFVISEYANKDRLLEHELGHALGWSHYNRYLHLMNSHYNRTGSDSHGLSFRDYQREISRMVD